MANVAPDRRNTRARVRLLREVVRGQEARHAAEDLLIELPKHAVTPTEEGRRGRGVSEVKKTGFLMKVLLPALMVLSWAMPAFSDSPSAGDAIIWEFNTCSFRHVDPTTGANHVISQWGCGGPTVGAGPVDWQPAIESRDITIQPDGWIYVIGTDLITGFDIRLYRIHPSTGTREFVIPFPDGTARLAFWPEPSFFPPNVAALSIGAAVLLIGALVGFGRRRSTKGAID